MKVSDYIAGRLKDEGITTVFGFQGSNVTHLINSIAAADGISYVQNHHEQACAFAANAYAVAGGGLGCAVASSGPGAINLISGIANAWLDSVPVVFLTGQLNSKSLKTDKNLRQHGFQEFDIVETVKGFTKYAVTVLDASMIRFHLDKAIFLAKSGRKGPVLIDLPHNIQTSDIDLQTARSFTFPDEHSPLSVPIFEISELLKRAERPLLLLGGGARGLKNNPLFMSFIERLDLAAVSSLNGIDVLPHDNARFFGFIGSYGSRCANLAVNSCDLLMVLGSRLDMRQTGDFPEEFAKNADIIRVDIDRFELSHNVPCKVAINCACTDFLQLLMNEPADFSANHSGWHRELKRMKDKYPPFSDDDPKTLPNHILRTASLAFSGNDVITADVGQNQMWTAQSVYIRDNMLLINSAGLGAMGFSLPAAIGASLFRNNARVLAVTGDGGFQMNIQELATVARERLAVKILVMNNQSLGLIRTYQNIVFKNSVGSVDGFSSPDYRILAESYNIPYALILSADDMAAAEPLLKNDLPLLAEVKLSPDTEVHPEPAYMKPVYIQSPIISDDK